MATFDEWNVPQNSLMHYRTKGSKNGERRFQNRDGTWTPLGLQRRKAREGWGEEGGSRAERRAQRRLERAERHQARREARAQARAAFAEKRRQNSLKGLTDAELQKKINRLKMEQEYKELSKSPLLKTGEKLVTSILEYKGNKEQRAIEANKQKIEMERIKTMRVQATEATKKAKYDANAAKSEAEKKRADVKGGLAIERKAQLTNAKTNYRGTTIWGAIGKRANNKAKYIQENRMNAIEANKAARTARQMQLNNEREKFKADQERYKAEQEEWKSGKKKKS